MTKDTQHKVWRLILDAWRAGDVEGAVKILTFLDPYTKNTEAYYRLRRTLRLEDPREAYPLVEEVVREAFPHLEVS